MSNRSDGPLPGTAQTGPRCICGGEKNDGLPRLDIICPACDGRAAVEVVDAPPRFSYDETTEFDGGPKMWRILDSTEHFFTLGTTHSESRAKFIVNALNAALIAPSRTPAPRDAQPDAMQDTARLDWLEAGNDIVVVVRIEVCP